jgi:ketosteroid isomerase-like protein
MSQGNVEMVRSIYAAWSRGDFSSIDWAHPDIELVIADGPTAGTVKGLAAMVESWREILRAWDDLRATAEEYRELDAERVLVLTRNTGRGKTSGLELGQIQTKGANLFFVRNAKVTRLVLYWDRDGVLADLGLKE